MAEGYFTGNEDLERRRALANALYQQSTQENANPGRMVSGHYVQTPLQSLSAAIKTGLGGYAVGAANRASDERQGEYSKALSSLLKGQPQGNSGSGPSPQISNAPQEMDPEGNPMASQAPAQGQPQSIMERIAASGNPALMYQFGPQALQAQMQNEMTRGNKLWENDLPQSRASREQGEQSLHNQEGLATFHNQLPQTAAELAADQRARAGQGETARHNRVEESIAQNPFGTGSTGQAVAQGKSGDEFLATLPPGVAAQIQAVGSYRQPAPAGRTSPTGMKFMSLVNQAYPSYDASQYGAKTKARNDFTTGKNGNTVRSLNVAVQHLDQLGQLSDAMGNRDVQLVNKIGNYFATQTGKPAPSNFNAAKQLVGDEIVKAIVGAGGGVSDREEAAHNISAASSPQQLAGVIQTYQGLLSGQLSGLKQQYEKSTGLNDFEDYLAPETKAKLQAHGKTAQASPAAHGGDVTPEAARAELARRRAAQGK